MLCSRHDLVEEFCIDSTYKTNREGSELFGILASVNGAGYPVAYLLVDTSLAPQNAVQPKTTILTHFLQSLSSMGMHPKFMFSDKDAAQMEAIRVNFGDSCLRLCLWHMLRAVQRKMSSNKSQRPPTYDVHELRQQLNFIREDFVPQQHHRDGLVCLRDKHSIIVNMMKYHYRLHPLIPIEDSSKCITFSHCL